MGFYKFKIPTLEEARATIASPVHSAESVGDRIVAQRRFAPVASPQEIAASQAFNRIWRTEGMAAACASVVPHVPARRPGTSGNVVGARSTGGGSAGLNSAVGSLDPVNEEVGRRQDVDRYSKARGRVHGPRS